MNEHYIKNACLKRCFYTDKVSPTTVCMRDCVSSPLSQLITSYCLSCSIQPVRTSMYGASYMEPTFRREDLLEPLDEVDPRRFKPIKAAKNEQTTSMNHDEVVLYVNCRV